MTRDELEEIKLEYEAARDYSLRTRAYIIVFSVFSIKQKYEDALKAYYEENRNIISFEAHRKK